MYYDVDKYDVEGWVKEIDTLLSTIRRLGLRLGLLKTQTGVKLFVENTVEEKREITTSNFGEIEVQDLDYEEVDVDTICLVGFLNSLAFRTREYGFMPLSLVNDNGILLGNGIPEDIKQGTLFYDDTLAESYIRESKTKWYPIVEKFIEKDGMVTPVFYDRNILQLGITDTENKGKMYYIIYVVSDYNGFIIRDGQWKKHLINTKG